MIYLPKIIQHNTSTGRFYETPEGNRYPSITTVLGAGDHSEIDAWKLAVGEEEANRVSLRASTRGSLIHKACEDHLLNNNVVINNLYDMATYKSLVPYLNRITNVQCLEAGLYSDKLKIAGSVDCIAEYDGVLSVIDFKTSSRMKYRNEIHSYFMQTSAYSYMFYERSKIVPKQLVIMMAVDFSPTQIFIESPKLWLPEFIKLRNKYDQINK